MSKKQTIESKHISDFVDAYDANVDFGFLYQQSYAFSLNAAYLPDPYIGFKIQIENSNYLSINQDGSRSVGSARTTDSNHSHKQLLLCYGGSAMFGSYASSDIKTIPGFLAQFDSVANNYEIKNFALPGGIVTQNFSHFLNYVYPKLKPGNPFKIVILFGYNEYRTIYHYGFHYNTPIISPLQAVLGNSILSRILRKCQNKS